MMLDIMNERFSSRFIIEGMVTRIKVEEAS
ncbi:hypothetical protein SAMN05877753_10513 [Bacillus oleivorans]|uniref:Uncharacterized protein n=1 Tax=Bacillus oleivorans TaxID=1448271 RepID=A0A285CUH9_9BACI|nr:hypothetical protein SAMN05877753_10513 [Bacillus oleivorans]